MVVGCFQNNVLRCTHSFVRFFLEKCESQFNFFRTKCTTFSVHNKTKKHLKLELFIFLIKIQLTLLQYTTTADTSPLCFGFGHHQSNMTVSKARVVFLLPATLLVTNSPNSTQIFLHSLVSMTSLFSLLFLWLLSLPSAFAS